MIESRKATGSGRLRVFLFQAAGKIFGLNAPDIREVVHMAELITPPGRPSFLSGFINIEGHAIPVVDLSVLLGFSEQPIEMYTPLVILKGAKTSVAMIVGKVLGFETIERIYPLGEASIFNQCVANSGKNGNEETFYLLSPEKIMLAQERQVTSEFREMAQKRLDALETKDAAHA